ncbi:MAG: hypothetical protein M1822_000562 [Bathelium mastoideum]|nr:MAG: hypothetical protein M1822_000562 [Bathelium mastoideum]
MTGPTDTAVALADAAEVTTAGAVSGGNFRGRELEEEVELTVEADLVDSDVLVGWLTSSGVAQAWEVASTVASFVPWLHRQYPPSSLGSSPF